MKEVMKVRGMSQASLSRETGIPTGLIARYYSGDSVPGLVKAQQIADALMVSLDFFTRDFDSPESLRIGVQAKLRYLEWCKSQDDYDESIGTANMIGRWHYEDWFYRKYVDPDDKDALMVESDVIKGVEITKLQRLILHLYHILNEEEKRRVDDILFEPERLAELLPESKSGQPPPRTAKDTEQGKGKAKE